MLMGFKYLKDNRHLTDETIRSWNLGYCDPKGIIYMGTNFSEKLSLDFKFNCSILFPIFDMYGALIGVSARSLDRKPDAPKYVNTVYAKANNLYGLHMTWKDCVREKKVYVVEGNVDTIMMWQAGVKNVVGMLGSNFSSTQLCLLGRFVDKVVFMPDGDSAGYKFVKKVRDGISKFDNANLEFSVVNLPYGYDPDKFVQEKGLEELRKLEVPLVKEK